MGNQNAQNWVSEFSLNSDIVWPYSKAPEALCDKSWEPALQWGLIQALGMQPQKQI